MYPLYNTLVLCREKYMSSILLNTSILLTKKEFCLSIVKGNSEKEFSIFISLIREIAIHSRQRERLNNRLSRLHN